MEISEVASLLSVHRETVKVIINDGLELPKSKVKRKLPGKLVKDVLEIEEADFDKWRAAFDAEDPGRHPPVAVMRALLVESRHRCGICGHLGPIEYHHLIEYSKVSHYDVDHMIAICPTDHALCTNGGIDKKSQLLYKQALKSGRLPSASGKWEMEPLRFNWNDLKELILSLHDVVKNGDSAPSGKYDRSYTDLPEKNELNGLGEEFFQMMETYHEPYFERIQEFIEDPMNSDIADIYSDIVDEVRAKLSTKRTQFNNFEDLLCYFTDQAAQKVKGKRAILSALVSYMYFHCDIGKKHASTNKVPQA